MLPQFGLSEFLVLAIVALIVVGPRDLPVMMRKLGQMLAKGRSMAREFQAAFDDIARQAELDELRKEIEDLKRNNALTQAQDDLRAMERDVNETVMRRDREAGQAGQAAQAAQSDQDGDATPVGNDARAAPSPSPAPDAPETGDTAEPAATSHPRSKSA